MSSANDSATIILDTVFRHGWGATGSERCELCRRVPALQGDHFCINCRCLLVTRFVETLVTMEELLPREPVPVPPLLTPRRKHARLRSRRLRQH